MFRMGVRFMETNGLPPGHRWAVVRLDGKVWLLVRTENVRATRFDIRAINKALERARV